MTRFPADRVSRVLTSILCGWGRASSSHAIKSTEMALVRDVPLSVGARVMLTGLQTQPDLNGLVGLVCGVVVRGRVPVALTVMRGEANASPQHKELAIKPENVVGVWADCALNLLSRDAPSALAQLGDAVYDIMHAFGSRLSPIDMASLMATCKEAHDFVNGVAADQPGACMGVLPRALLSREVTLPGIDAINDPCDCVRQLRALRRFFDQIPDVLADMREQTRTGVFRGREIISPSAISLAPHGLELWLLKMIDHSSQPVAREVHESAVALLNVLGGTPSPDPSDKKNVCSFSNWRGVPKSIGGVPGRGSLTHLDPGGDMNIFSSFLGGLRCFEYSAVVEGAATMRTLPKYSMLECGDDEEEKLARFRFTFEESGLIELVKGQRVYDGPTPACQPFQRHLLANHGQLAVQQGRAAVHHEDAMWLLFGSRERPTLPELRYQPPPGGEWKELFSRLRLTPAAFKMHLERRYAQLLATDPGNNCAAELPKVLEAPLPAAAQAHVAQIIEAMEELPKDVWLCTVCACPTTKYFGAGRYYCCYSCERRDEGSFILESAVAADDAFAANVRDKTKSKMKELVEEHGSDVAAFVVKKLQLSLHLVELLSGAYRPTPKAARTQEQVDVEVGECMARIHSNYFSIGEHLDGDGNLWPTAPIYQCLNEPHRFTDINDTSVNM